MANEAPHEFNPNDNPLPPDPIVPEISLEEIGWTVLGGVLPTTDEPIEINIGSLPYPLKQQEVVVRAMEVCGLIMSRDAIKAQLDMAVKKSKDQTPLDQSTGEALERQVWEVLAEKKVLEAVIDGLTEAVILAASYEEGTGALEELQQTADDCVAADSKTTFEEIPVVKAIREMNKPIKERPVVGILRGTEEPEQVRSSIGNSVADAALNAVRVMIVKEKGLELPPHLSLVE